MENLTIIRKPTSFGADFFIGKTVGGLKYWLKKPVKVSQALLDDDRFDIEAYLIDHAPKID